MFYGITHGKRMVNAHLSRVPISHYWYMRTDDPMLAWLGQRRFIEPEVVEAADAAAHFRTSRLATSSSTATGSAAWAA